MLSGGEFAGVVRKTDSPLSAASGDRVLPSPSHHSNAAPSSFFKCIDANGGVTFSLGGALCGGGSDEDVQATSLQSPGGGRNIVGGGAMHHFVFPAPAATPDGIAFRTGIAANNGFSMRRYHGDEIDGDSIPSSPAGNFVQYAINNQQVAADSTTPAGLALHHAASLAAFQQQQQHHASADDVFCELNGGGGGAKMDGAEINSPFYNNHHGARAASADYGYGATSNARFLDVVKQEPATFSHSESTGSLLNGSSCAPKSFIPCKVCGDKASGYHYGVTSCEGCKGFFRRSIQKQIEYRCLRDGKCMVYRLNRNRCQYCRFKKCLAVGMSRDSVRYGRVPKRSRERLQDDARVSSCTDPELDQELEKRQLALYDIILSVSQAHHSNCAYTDDKIKNLSHHPLHFSVERTIGDDSLAATEIFVEQQKILMWETLAHFTTPEIQRVVEFAKRIPNFTELMQDDQLILIKTGFFEVWLIRMARMFNAQQFTLTFSDGSFLTRDQLELIYSIDLVAQMFAFSVGLNNLHLNDGEVGLFTAVVLLTPDRYGLNDPKLVEQQQEKLTEALKMQLSRSHSSDPQVFPNLLHKLSDLRAVGLKHNEVLNWYRLNWRRFQLPPLFAEIYDVPKMPNATSNGIEMVHDQSSLIPPTLQQQQQPVYNNNTSVTSSLGALHDA